MGKLEGKVVVVTGAARGQGAAEVAALAAAGATVVGTDVAGLRPPPATRRDLAPTDVGGGRHLAGAVSTARCTHWSTTPASRPASDCRMSRWTTWHQTFDINVTGPLLGIQALAPLMPPGSSIVNICSVAAVSGHAAAAYTASKWALRGLTRSAALELGSTRGIRVNAVMPGLVDTPLMESASPAFFDAALAEIPLSRVGTSRTSRRRSCSCVRRLGLLQRRGARHRRRPHRTRLAQGDRRRHSSCQGPSA